jgi:uncharacterized protein DUF1876
MEGSVRAQCAEGDEPRRAGRSEESMNELDVWTISLTIRSDDTVTRADAFLQGPAVEVACSGVAGADSRVAGVAPTRGDDLAAARALEELAGRLIDRAACSRARPEQRADLA